MEKKPIENAKEYIENCMRAENGDLGFIAWRFLVGCRILESLEDMMGVPNQGTDIEVEYINTEHSKVRFGDYEIYLAHKPEGSGKSVN